jgi:hypothetical protein
MRTDGQTDIMKLIVTAHSFATASKIPFLHNTYNFFRLLASSAPADVLLMMLVGMECMFTGTPARNSLVIAARACQVHFLRSIKICKYCCRLWSRTKRGTRAVYEEVR